MLDVIEKFVSLDGEGPTAGERAVFIRFAGCNLRCSWCDTAYSWDDSVVPEPMTVETIVQYVVDSHCRNVTLTGGEPLQQAEIGALLAQLGQHTGLVVHIETNGAVDITPFQQQYPFSNVHYIVDYKLPSSGMEAEMVLDNLTAVGIQDVYKFVVASPSDLQRALELIEQYQLTERCLVYLSPVREEIDPLVLVEAMQARELDGVRLQLQLHKLLWPKEMRGV